MPYYSFEPDYYEDNREDSWSVRVECKKCGKAGLHWEKLPEGYRLVHPSGRIHKCKAKAITLDLAMKL